MYIRSIYRSAIGNYECLLDMLVKHNWIHLLVLAKLLYYVTALFVRSKCKLLSVTKDIIWKEDENEKKGTERKARSLEKLPSWIFSFVSRKARLHRRSLSRWSYNQLRFHRDFSEVCQCKSVQVYSVNKSCTPAQKWNCYSKLPCFVSCISNRGDKLH